MEWFVLLGVVVLLVAAVLLKGKRKARTDADDDGHPYEIKGPLFSPAERSFYGVLAKAVKGEAVVFGKVRVADVLQPSRGMEKKAWWKAFSLISSKHFDYVICAPDTLSVLAVIELDDSSHSGDRRTKRDRFLEDACSGAGLKLYRFKAAATYNINDVRNTLFPEPEGAGEQPPPSATPQENSEDNEHPACPRCASPLVKRVARRGEHKGSEFLACSTFPKCRYIRKLDVPA